MEAENGLEMSETGVGKAPRAAVLSP
jgi:hypothetical protein